MAILVGLGKGEGDFTLKFGIPLLRGLLVFALEGGLEEGQQGSSI